MERDWSDGHSKRVQKAIDETANVAGRPSKKKESVELEAIPKMVLSEREELIAGLQIICQRCCHEIHVFGQSASSLKYACYRMSQECPEGEKNWYKAILAEE